MADERSAMASLVHGLPLAAILIGPDERVWAGNERAGQVLGLSLEGRHYLTVLRQPALLEAIETAMGGATHCKARYLSSGQGRDLTFQVTCSGVDTPSGRGVLMVFEDQTHVEETAQMRRDFIANVSHELRTPLTALMGFVETLRGPAKDDANARDRFLGVMESEAQRMNRLVDDLLSLNRVEADERRRPTAPVALGDLVASTLSRLMPLAEKADVTLTAKVPDKPITVPGDADQLRQVLSNLIENAIKYGGNGGSVTVNLSEPAYVPRLRRDGVELSVTDTGPGIPLVHLPRLTERFYRVDGHRSRQMGGTGLGLAIVKHIASRHRGRLQISSVEGQGSTFTLQLPLD